MAQVQRGVDRRRKRSYADETILPGYLFHSYFCCEVVARLRDDINCLSQDLKRLSKLKSEMEVQHKKFEVVCANARQKLKSLVSLKVMHHGRTANMTEMKAVEVRDFLKYTWSLANQVLDKRAQKSTFLSVRGNRLLEYINDLITMTESVQANYGNEFFHTECSALYSILNNQLQGLLAPELAKADTIEFSNSYINSAIPAMVNFMSIIDMYLHYPRLSNVITLCNELFNKSPAISNRSCKTVAMRALASLLRGPLMGVKPLASTLPAVEGRVANFCSLGVEVAQYILSKSAVVKAPSSPVPLVLLGPGLLDPRFALPPKRTDPNPQPLAPAPDEPDVPALTRPVPTRGRGRPRKRALRPTEEPTQFPSLFAVESQQCSSVPL